MPHACCLALKWNRTQMRHQCSQCPAEPSRGFGILEWSGKLVSQGTLVKGSPCLYPASAIFIGTMPHADHSYSSGIAFASGGTAGTDSLTESSMPQHIWDTMRCCLSLLPQGSCFGSTIVCAG